MSLSWADITPQDLISVVEMTDQQLSFANRFFSQRCQWTVLWRPMGGRPL